MIPIKQDGDWVPTFRRKRTEKDHHYRNFFGDIRNYELVKLQHLFSYEGRELAPCIAPETLNNKKSFDHMVEEEKKQFVPTRFFYSMIRINKIANAYCYQLLATLKQRIKERHRRSLITTAKS